MKETTFLARTNFRGAERVFGIKTKDRRQHTYVIGKTGTGKTVLLKNMAVQDIRAGRGVGIIDPHGEFVEEVLSQIPPERTNDIIYFNPVDVDYPIGFNVLEVADPKYKHLVVSDLLGIFTKIWANVWSARMEYILQNCILALLDTPGTTLLGIPRILVDKDYREKIVANIKDPVVRSFWVHEYETWRDQFRNEAIVPIQNKVGQFLNTSFIRNIVGQSTSTLDIPQIMNERKILLVNVSKGRIGEDNSGLLGAMIITKIQLAAMERVRIAEEERNDFYLYVDEFQNFATDSFASILSEARKYRLDLILAHQYTGQLVTDRSTKVRDAVFGNVGTMISFRVGADDAEFLEKEFEPEFMPQDLVNLPNHHVYLKLMVDGVTSRPFSAVTLPPLQFESDPGVREKVIRVSRERYTRPRIEVEEKIARWTGMTGGEGESEEGKMYDTICSNCGKETKVPFKPDGKRPAYCLSCLRQIEEGKLIPLPERMPQLGRTRFSDTLGGFGIEFAVPNMSNAAARTASGPRYRSESAARRSVSAPASAPEQSRGLRVQREPVQAPWRPVRIRSEGGVSAAGRSRTVVRPPAGAKPISLAELKSRGPSTGDRGKPRPMREADTPGRGAKTIEVNLGELRKTLESALRERDPQRAKSRPKEQKNVVQPGEAIRF